jgi:hypothetical protein
MRKFIAGLILVVASFSVSAQGRDPVCLPAGKIIGELIRDFGENPILTASNETGEQTLVFFANANTTTWTIVIFNADFSAGCAITSGFNYKPFIDTEDSSKIFKS